MGGDLQLHNIKLIIGMCGIIYLYQHTQQTVFLSIHMYICFCIILVAFYLVFIFIWVGRSQVYNFLELTFIIRITNKLRFISDSNNKF